MTKLPILLKRTGTSAPVPDRIIHPESGGLVLNKIPLSTATLTLKTDEVVPVRSLVEMFSPNGSEGVYRVRTSSRGIGDEATSSVELEHAITELGDYLVTVNAEEVTTLAQGLTKLFTENYHGSLWQIGTLTANDSVLLNASHDNLLESMISLMEQAPDYLFTFDFSTFPWTLGITKRDMTPTAEGRISRNVLGATITYDDSDLCTRVYVEYSASGGSVTNYLIMNASTSGTYGVIEKYLSGGYSQAEAQIVGNSYIESHKHPTVAVDITGIDLSQATGEPLDTFRPGKLFRLALPEYGTTVEQDITSMEWDDLYGNPESVNIALADVEDPVIRFLKKQSAAGKGTRNTVIKKTKEYWTKFSQTDTEIQAVAGHSSANGEILRLAGLSIDEHGVLQYAEDHDDPDSKYLGSKFYVQAGAISAEVQRATSAEGLLESHLGMTDSAITAEVTRATGEEGRISGLIEVTAEEIRSEVSASNCEIYTSIRQTATGIRTLIADTESGLRSYTDQTASGLHSLLVRTTNQTWIQEADPRTEAGGSHTVKVGDIWIESTHQGTWDGAEGFDWDHDEQYDWNQIQGAKVWGWQNDRWELVTDQQQVVSYRDVVDTADQYVRRYVAGIVNDEGLVEIYLARLEMTAQELRSDISAASSTIYTSIQQTATNILLQAGERPRTVVSKTQPTSIDGRGLKEDDVWIESEGAHNWEDLEDADWGDESAIDWNKLRSDIIHVYKDGRWQVALDGTTLLEDADVEVDKKQAKMYARKLDTVDGQLQQYYAEMKVTANQIRSQVSEYYSGLGSSITQTAREIRAEVHAGKCELWSEILQTATSITLSVANEVSDLRSRINQTAGQIDISVSAAKTSMYSAIVVTKSIIDLSVANSVSNLQSQINQTAAQITISVSAASSKIYSKIEATADRIETAVANELSDVQSRIMQTADQIDISVSRESSKIYSSIRATTTQIHLSVANELSGLSSSIKATTDAIEISVTNNVSDLRSRISQTAGQIDLSVSAASSKIYSSIKIQKDRIDLVVSGEGSDAKIRAAKIVASVNDAESSVIISADHINLDGYVKATDLTTNWLSTQIANITNLSVNNVTASSLKVLVGQTLSDVATQTYVSGCPYDLRLTSSGNTYTLQWKRLGGSSSWSDIGSFSRATSLSGTWSGTGKFTVTASPQNEKLERTLVAKSAVNNQVPIYARYGSSGQYEEDTGFRVSLPAYVSKTLRCTKIEQTYPGSSSNYYYFRYESSSANFNENTNYTFYRTSW